MKQSLWRMASGGILVGALGCSPALDWREMRPEGTELAVAMPCRPAKEQHEFDLAGRRVVMRLLACRSDGALFGLGHVRLPDATLAGAALTALAGAAHSNARGTVNEGGPAQVPGMTPLPQARQWRWAGTGPDGKAVTAWVTVFAYGPNVYQATVVGTPADEALARHFRSALAVRPAGAS
jgi:hypothetical protein